MERTTVINKPQIASTEHRNPILYLQSHLLPLGSRVEASVQSVATAPHESSRTNWDRDLTALTCWLRIFYGYILSPPHPSFQSPLPPWCVTMPHTPECTLETGLWCGQLLINTSSWTSEKSWDKLLMAETTCSSYLTGIAPFWSGETTS